VSEALPVVALNHLIHSHSPSEMNGGLPPDYIIWSPTALQAALQGAEDRRE